MPLHANATGTDLHEAKRDKEPVRAASTANVTLATPGSTLDGVTLTSGDRVLLKDQSTASQNGIYVWTGSASTLTRTADADSAADFVKLFTVKVSEGTVGAGTTWLFTQSAAITLGTTALTFASASSSGTFAGEVQGTDFKATGLTGAVTASRYVGGTASVAPTTGTFSVGDFVITANGKIWICTSAGSPGTWTQSDTTAASYTVSGLTGATSASRYVGATTSGPPTTGTFAVGDFVIAQDGSQWTCTSAGSPGTWKKQDDNPMTTVGDIVYGGTVANGIADMTRLAAGTSGQVLTSAGAGVAPSWAAPTGGSGSSGGGGSGALVPIQVIGPLTTAQATLSFTAPTTGFRNLYLKGQIRGSTAATTTAVNLTINGDTGNNYNTELSQQSAASNTASESLSTSNIASIMSAASATASRATSFYASIPNYLSTTFHKNIWTEVDFSFNDSTANTQMYTRAGTWRNAAAISTITLTPAAGNFDVGSYMCLYGEMDTAGVLLTPASNLLYETVLTAAQPSISTGTLSQAYRDLLITIHDARGDTAAQSTNIRVTANSDSGANYNYQSVFNSGTTTSTSNNTGQTSFLLGDMTAASATANFASGGDIRIYGYSSGSLFKTILSRMHLSASTQQNNEHRGWWASSAAITSLQFTPAAGNFNAGTTIRVYGDPVSAGGTSVGTGTRLRISANQSITTATATAIGWDTPDNDADNQHYESTTTLGNTSSKTAGSATLTGSSTAYLTELSVGQVIAVPGTATEKRVVIAIASNTSLTVNTPFVNSASGQSVSRVNTAIVFRQPGFYTLETNIYSAALSTGAVVLQYYLNSLTTATSGTAIGQRDPVAINASAGYDLVATRQFQMWDFVEVVWTQNSGGSVNVLADERTHFAVNARPTVIVAVPYVNIQDQKAQNTQGGTFTSGADRTRDLNTIVSDTAGIATLASNQVTLPAGTYRCYITAPAAAVDRHQAWLYNTTDAATVFRGSSEVGSTSIVSSQRSTITGRFTISAPKTFEVRHRCQTTLSGKGFGYEANFGTEVYTIVELWKEA